jgi:3',5'-cyclic AMP phosphodiesterase CpdA
VKCNPVFLRAIDVVNRLSPDLVLLNGDLIYGGDPPALRQVTETKWRAFETGCRRFAMPFRLIEGNHDIWDNTSFEIYEKHFGPVRYGFAYRGAYFIVLDTCEKWSDVQLRFLADQLKIAGNKPTFLFLHIPLWWPGGRLGNTWPMDRPVDGFWAAKVHPMLVRAGNVQAVFGSHEHYYVYQKFDAIHYIISGGGGAEFHHSGGELTGTFLHALMVAVEPDKRKTRISVLPLDGVRPVDTVTPVQRYVMLDQTLRLRHWPEADTGYPLDMTHKITLENPFADPMNIEVFCLVDPKSNWTVRPIVAKVTVAPGKKGELSWHVQTPKAAEPAPIFLWQTRCGPRFTQEQGKIWIH